MYVKQTIYSTQVGREDGGRELVTPGPATFGGPRRRPEI